MQVFFYDQTFDGLLCAVFEAYRLKRFPDQLLALDAVPPLFVEYSTSIQTDVTKTQRVWQTVSKKASRQFCHQLLLAWFSEQEGSDLLIFNVIRKLVDSPMCIETAYGDADILALRQVSRVVGKEYSFLMQFVRFQKTQDDIYFSPVKPAYDILPIAIPHFKDRFADQKWLIYDVVRGYGFFYNLKEVVEVRLDKEVHFLKPGVIKPEALTPDELLIQKMWKNYFKSVSIPERRNLKQQRQNMPQRFWHLLPEMQK